MQVTEITVHASRTLPHPIESYANIKPAISLKATLDPGEDPAAAIRQLQGQAENLVEEHAAILKASIEERELLKTERDELRRMEESVRSNQAKLQHMQERIKSRQADLPGQGLLFDG